MATVRRARRRRDLMKERRWRQLMRDWRMSGLSIRSFCKQTGLSQPSFYAWRRELAQRNQETAQRRTRATNRPSQPVPPFLPVQVVSAGPHDADRNGCLEVQLPAQVLLRVPSGFDRQTLADVLTALKDWQAGPSPC